MRWTPWTTKPTGTDTGSPTAPTKALTGAAKAPGRIYPPGAIYAPPNRRQRISQPARMPALLQPTDRPSAAESCPGSHRKSDAP